MWAFNHIIINHHGPPKLSMGEEASRILGGEGDKQNSRDIGQEGV